MIRSEILNILENTWPTIIICIIIIATLRLMYLYREKEKFILYKELIDLLFMVYILCLFHTVTVQDNLLPGSNFIPFKEIFRYTPFSHLFIKNILGNIIMFIPYGFFVGHYLKLDKKIVGILLALIVSVSIELTQLAIGRVFDIDDIILNTIGGFIGVFLYTCLKFIKNIMPSFLKKDWFYNIIVLLIFIIFFAFLNGTIELGV